MMGETVAARYTLVSHALCPYVQRAAIALSEKNIAFERRYVDLADKPAWFKAMSPLGKVPLLLVRRDDAADSVSVVFESAVICEYFEDAETGRALHPADPLERARHRSWIEFASSILADLWHFETAVDAQTYETKRRALADKFARVEDELSGGPFFSGRPFSLVDAAFAPIFRYFDVFDTLTDTRIFEQTPKVRAWRRVLSERPSVQGAVMPDYGSRLLAFLKAHDAHLLELAETAAPSAPAEPAATLPRYR
jgi:glutathione S-transferase